ncbi:MAG: nuclear transport factor 2 family protein [Gemmatimonadetes bacterium]|nr:nuclear transport factor 2 family protein [Gemmatimonadota bacterium]NNM03993.1 nuclear transport factor 2 family protein [Gemmatimonadota bacterium]
MRTLSLVLLGFLALGCQQYAEEAVEEMAPDRSAQTVEADFEALRADWQALAIADDAAGVADYYAEDAVFTDAYGNIYNGREAILGYLEGSFSTAGDLMIETTDIAFHGDMVAGYGTFTQTVAGPEGDMTMTGMWQTVSMYQADGSVKILFHQSMLPAEPPEM